MKRTLVLTAILACAQTVSGQIAKQPTAKLVMSATTIEVRRFSGDFEEWTDTFTIHTPQSLTLRWKTTLSTASAGVWQVSDKPFIPSSASPLGATVLKSGPLPSVTPGGNAMPFTVDFGTILTTPPKVAPTVYFVRAVPTTAAGHPAGKTFPVARIIHAKATGGSRLQFDYLWVTGASPYGGALKGIPPNSTIAVMNDTNSIRISYGYEVNSVASAEVRQWLLVASGVVAQNNFWYSSTAKQGKGTTSNRATITCETPGQGPTVITAIAYKLTSGNAVLAEGSIAIPGGVTFTCPLTPGQ